jgi:hypothetical protein
VWLRKTFTIRKQCVAKSYPDTVSAVSKKVKTPEKFLKINIGYLKDY